MELPQLFPALVRLRLLYSEAEALFDRINRIDRMNPQILIKHCQSRFGDATHCPSIILFIPLILSKFRWAASINGMVTP
jgi:hypothetical protein